MYIYIYSMVFLDINMPLLESMLLSLLLTPVENGALYIYIYAMHHYLKQFFIHFFIVVTLLVVVGHDWSR